MQPHDLTEIGGLLFVALYIACIIGIIIYVLRMLGKFVSAHEKMAASLDVIARKLKDESRS